MIQQYSSAILNGVRRLLVPTPIRRGGRHRRCTAWFLLLAAGPLFSQGNNCNQALVLNNVSNFCSSASQYTNSGSNASGLPAASCWTASPLEDVWFSFVSIGTEALIAINGSTIFQPRIALYTGSCSGTLTQVSGACSNGSPGSQDAQLYAAGLTQGTTYFIRVSSIQSQEGSFQLCINNYTPPASASPDCTGAGRLCNKDPLSVSGLNGGGTNINETFGTCLDGGFGMPETNSIWYTWTCAAAGTLIFDLFPANQMDDIDFALFQLNTSDPCGPRTLIRCSAASCTNALASTGMNLSSTDVSEAPGCFGTDAYVQFINMTAGTSYALLINNFSAATGFTLNWGGAGTFVGPEANITGAPFTICAGDTVSLNGSTSANYTTLNWNFANGSGNPPAAAGPGPIDVTYATPGTYTAILNATSATGCTSVETATITVSAIVTPTFALPSAVCQDALAPVLPATSANGISGTWSPASVNTATPGTTTYTFTPNTGLCATSTTATITVNPAVILAFPAVPAFCEGSAAPPFPVQTNSPVITGIWSPGIISTSLSGTYTFTPDPGQCASAATIDVTVNNLPVVTVSSNSPLCPGDQLDLSANTLAGGVYDWDGPANFDSNAEDPSIVGITALAAGDYTLHLTDQNGCTNQAVTTVVINGPVTPVLTPVGPFCAQDANPVALAANIPNGTWTGTGVTDPAGVFIPSVAGAGTHTLTYTHTQGCGGFQTMDVVVTAVPVADFSADTLSGCSPFVVQFSSDPNVTASGWDFGDGATDNTVGGTSHTYTSPGSYTVTLTNTVNGCNTTHSIPDYILVFPDVHASFVAGTTLLSQYNTEVVFYNNSVGSTSYVWDFGDGLSSTLEHTSHQYPSTPASYTVTLTASNQAGCSDVTSVLIVVEEDQLIYVPNSFTPDGDEHNNLFVPVLSEGFDLYSYELFIFNRWGEIVFESRDTKAGWDGTYHGELVPGGIYTWTIRVKNKTNDVFTTYDGHVLLVR